MRLTTVLKKLLNLKAIFVLGVICHSSAIVVQVRPTWRRPRCGLCKRPGKRYDTKKEPRLWRHLNLGHMRIFLSYSVRRVNCRHCGGVHVEHVPWAEHGSRFTAEFENLVGWLAQGCDKTRVTMLTGVNWRTVGTIAKRLVERLLPKDRFDKLYMIGVDEISYRKNHKYVTLVMDHVQHRIIWGAEGKGQKTLGSFFAELGKERCAEVDFISLDMSRSFTNAAKEHLKNAELIYDPFHVKRQVNGAVDQVRREIVHELKGTDSARFIKKSRWALLKNPWNLTATQQEKLAEVQRTNRRLYRAYLIKEAFTRVMDYAQPWRAEKALKEWLGWACRSKLEPIVEASRTIRRHWDGILAYIRCRFSNGPLEALNNKVRLIQRRSYGLHSASSLIALVMLCCGGISIDAPLPGPCRPIHS